MRRFSLSFLPLTSYSASSQAQQHCYVYLMTWEASASQNIEPNTLALLNLHIAPTLPLPFSTPFLLRPPPPPSYRLSSTIPTVSGAISACRTNSSLALVSREAAFAHASVVSAKSSVVEEQNRGKINISRNPCGYFHCLAGNNRYILHASLRKRIPVKGRMKKRGAFAEAVIAPDFSWFGS